MRSRAERLHAARLWHRNQPRGSAPELDDVLVVAAMDVLEPAVLEGLLLLDRPRLLASWHSLRNAVNGEAERVISDRPLTEALGTWSRSGQATVNPAAAWVPGEAGPTPQPGPEPTSQPFPAPVLEPATTEERLARLTAWRDERAPTTPSLRELTDVDLARIAGSSALTPDEVRALPLRAKLAAMDNADAISAVLLSAGHQPAGHQPAGHEPAGHQPAGHQPASPKPVGPEQVCPAPSDQADPASADPAPADPQSAGTPQPAGTTWLADRSFAAFSWDVPADPEAATQVSATVTGDGVRLTWPASQYESDGWFAYRIVAGEEYPPTSAPDSFDLVGVTRQCHGLDKRAPAAAVRHYAVWINHGPDEARARASQPRLHAAGFVVHGVDDLHLRVEGDRVHAQWHPKPGTSGAKVMRVPADRAESLPGYDPSLTFPDQLQVKSSGFTDNPPTGGVFRYRVFAVVDVLGRDVLSAPVEAEATVAENVDPVTDLSLTRHPDRTVTLTWSAPRAGRVELYRLSGPPPEGLGDQVRSRAVVAGVLPADARLIQSTETVEGRCSMSDVHLPTGWTRAHFVPVTVLDEQHVRVGQAHVLIVPAAPTQARCVERVSTQVLSFAWPEAVELVRVHSGPRGTSADEAVSAPLAELTREQYDEQGGIHLSTPLPAEGCALHLYGVSYHAGLPVLSSPVTIDYPGLVRLNYHLGSQAPAPVEPAPTPRGLFGRGSAPAPTGPPAAPTRDLRVTVGHRLHQGRLLLVHHPTRLPLHSHDGTVVLNEEVTLAPHVETAVGQGLAWQPGWLRLFVVGLGEGHPPVAVLDPAVTNLRTSQ